MKRSDDKPAWSPLCRFGEIDYASLQRNRSGQDSGEIDYAIRVDAIAKLHQKEKARLLRTAEAMLVQLRRYCT